MTFLETTFIFESKFDNRWTSAWYNMLTYTKCHFGLFYTVY